jgi:hypothetical protein
MRVAWFVVIFCALLMAVTSCAGFLVPAQAAYGAEVAFAPGSAVQYPDFSLEYVGQHRVIPEQYPRGFLYYDFRITHGDLAQDVSWTDGTGEIGPVDFMFDGVAYTLEVTDRSGMEPFTAGRAVVEKLGH